MAKITPWRRSEVAVAQRGAPLEDILITSLSRLSTSTKSLPGPGTWRSAPRPRRRPPSPRARAARGARGARRETRAPAKDAGKERAEDMADIVLVGDRAGPVAPVGVGAIDARDRLG